MMREDRRGCFEYWYGRLKDLYSIPSTSSLRFIHTGICTRWPLSRRRYMPNKNAAEYTATALNMTGYRNCDGCDQMMVVTYESSSKAFWNEASVDENEPR